MRSMDWRQSYDALIARLDAVCASARWTFCGLGACVDAVVPASAAIPALRGCPDAAGRALGEELARRAGAGIGGEIRVHWESGAAWIDAALAPRTALGGTGPHAARALCRLGAPALLALEHRNAEQLASLDGDIRLAVNGRPTAARSVVPSGTPRPKIYIFEFTAGQPAGGVMPPRSSRVIVRFTDPDIEDDRDFIATSIGLGDAGGAGLVSGFNALDGAALDRALRTGCTLARRWRQAGVPVVHLEMAGYGSAALRDRTLQTLSGSITSAGFSQSEYRALVPGETEAATIVATAERLRLRRLCIHADGWAMAATRDDPAQEREALMTGCLLAATRAASGRPMRPTALPPDACFATPPPERQQGIWQVVTCAAPYLAHPATTLGLGDTFVAGCLLVLGQPNRREAALETTTQTWGNG